MLILMGIVLPLLLIKNISKLRYNSVFGFACILYVTIIVIEQWIPNISDS